MNEHFEALAGRGKRRGAHAVLEAALADARADEPRGGGANGGGAVGGFDDLAVLEPGSPDEPPVTQLTDMTTPRKRRPWRTALTAGGLAAMLGVVSLGIASLLGGGGSNSPDGAVRQLASAIDHEDPLAAVGVLAPNEVQTLSGSVDAASKRAAEIDLVNSAGAPFAGVDLGVHGLDLETQELAPGYAKVMVRGGAITMDGDPSRFSDIVRRAVPDISTGSLDLATAHPFDVAPFVMAVERDGKWYVSPAYTVLEYVRVANDLPAADFGSGLRATAQLGAVSPALAARGALDAYQAGDWEKLFSLAPPDELPVYDYRAALGELIGRNNESHFTIDQFDATVIPDGDAATVDVRAAGHTGDGNQWSLGGDCFTTTTRNVIFYDPNGAPIDGPARNSICARDNGALPYSFVATDDGGGSVRFVTERHGARWFVSPTRSVLGYVDAWIGNVDRNDVAALLNDYGAVEPRGALTLGTPVAVQPNEVAAFTFRGRAGQKVVGRVETNAAVPASAGASVYLVGSDGHVVVDGYGVGYGMPATLPVEGTYRVVVVSYDGHPAQLTLWDAAHAPAGVIDENADTVAPGEDCSVESDGSVTCVTSSSGLTSSGSGSGSGSSTPTSVAGASTTVPWPQSGAGVATTIVPKP